MSVIPTARNLLAPKLTSDAVQKLKFLHVGYNALLFLGVMLFSKSDWFVLNAFTVDSIFVSIVVMIKTLSGVSLRIYDITTYQRYIFYMVIASAYGVIEISTWGRVNNITRPMVHLMLYPYAIKSILQNQHIEAFKNKVFKRAIKLFKFMVFSLSAKILNMVSEACLDCDPCISWMEAEYRLEGTKMKNIKQFLRLFTLASLINYLEQHTYFLNKMFTWSLNILYNYGNVPSRTTHPKDKLTELVVTRKWNVLNDPCILNELINVYRSNPKNPITEVIRQRTRSIRKSVGVFSALWSISLLFPNMVFVTHIISVFLINKRILIDSGIAYRHRYRYLCRIMGVIVTHNHGIVPGLFVSEFLEYVDNPLTWWMLDQIRQFYTNNVHKISSFNKYNRDIVSCVGVLAITNNPFIYAVALPSLNVHKYIMSIYIILGYLSSYNFLHLVLLGTIIYFGLNIIHIRDAPYKNIQMEIIDDFIPRGAVNAVDADTNDIIRQFVQIDGDDGGDGSGDDGDGGDNGDDSDLRADDIDHIIDEYVVDAVDAVDVVDAGDAGGTTATVAADIIDGIKNTTELDQLIDLVEPERAITPSDEASYI